MDIPCLNIFYNKKNLRIWLTRGDRCPQQGHSATIQNPAPAIYAVHGQHERHLGFLWCSGHSFFQLHVDLIQRAALDEVDPTPKPAVNQVNGEEATVQQVNRFMGEQVSRPQQLDVTPVAAHQAELAEGTTARGRLEPDGPEHAAASEVAVGPAGAPAPLALICHTVSPDYVKLVASIFVRGDCLHGLRSCSRFGLA